MITAARSATFHIRMRQGKRLARSVIMAAAEHALQDCSFSDSAMAGRATWQIEWLFAGDPLLPGAPCNGGTVGWIAGMVDSSSTKDFFGPTLVTLVITSAITLAID